MEKAKASRFRAEKNLLGQYEAEYKVLEIRLSTLQKDHQNLLALINALRARMGLELLSPPREASRFDPKSALSQPEMAVKKFPYRGLNLLEAIERCLKNEQRPMFPREIADSLRDGNFYTKSKNFLSMVNTALQRLKKKEQGAKVENHDRKWGLAEWKKRKRNPEEPENIEGQP